MPTAPAGAGPPLAQLAAFAPTAVYEVPEAAPRASVVAAAEVDPDPNRQTERMFDAAFDPASVVLLDADPPPPAGEPGDPHSAGAEVIDETTTSVAVRATAPEGGGYLVLLDSYDPHWVAEVDGRPAHVLRANGLFRAVRIAAGAHTVRFAYRPRPLYYGLAITGLALVVLAGLGMRREVPRVSAEC
jgi:hypothetical protein